MAPISRDPTGESPSKTHKVGNESVISNPLLSSHFSELQSFDPWNVAPYGFDADHLELHSRELLLVVSSQDGCVGLTCTILSCSCLCVQSFPGMQSRNTFPMRTFAPLETLLCGCNPLLLPHLSIQVRLRDFSGPTTPSGLPARNHCLLATCIARLPMLHRVCLTRL